MEMQYLMHFAHAVFSGSRIAFCGQLITHDAHAVHFSASIAGRLPGDRVIDLSCFFIFA
jgi:hypothetical protein